MYEFAGYNDAGKATYYVHDDVTNARTGEVTETPVYKDRTIVGNCTTQIKSCWNNTLIIKIGH